MASITQEQWKEIPGYDGYLVSESGKILNTKTNTILRYALARGYPHVKTYNTERKNKTLYIHRAVALAFIPNPNNLPEVNHIDGNKQNFQISNLEWVSNRDNKIHSGRVLFNCCKKIVCCETNKIYNSIALAAEETGISRRSIINNLRGWSKTSGGFHWKYAQ